VKYAEEFADDFIPNISSCKSPQQMMGAVIKSYFAEQINTKPEEIYSVSIMPCTAKKFEMQRVEMNRNGINDVDAVLTTREISKLIKLFGIDIKSLEPETTDSPMGIRSTAGKLFANTGGVMEAALRTAHFKLTGKELLNFKIPQVRGLDGIKEAKMTIAGIEVGVAVVSGLANAQKLLQEIRNGRKDLHFIEIMACPGGCISGGGQPINSDESILRSRIKAIYSIDHRESIKVSHKNPEIIEIYQNFLEKPLSHKSHELLHTHYEKRDVLK
jgi:iron only hydrogenase large subunit-like protein